jgi:hypothetical protein
MNGIRSTENQVYTISDGDSKRIRKRRNEKNSETIAKSGNGSFLAVLKLFGKNNPKLTIHFRRRIYAGIGF